jgi:hypothetical protein
MTWDIRNSVLNTNPQSPRHYTIGPLGAKDLNSNDRSISTSGNGRVIDSAKPAARPRRRWNWPAGGSPQRTDHPAEDGDPTDDHSF